VRRVAEVVIDCHIDDVFAFLSDLANAPRWAADVVSVDQVAGEGPGPGALYDVVRRARRRQRRTAVVCVGWEPPTRVAWREDRDDVTYELESVWTATRVTTRGGAARDLRGLRRALEGC
jgi:polyketide cyclase/dehydrase/lipid transport protein